MAGMDKKIDELSEKSKSMKANAKVQADSSLAALRTERAALGEKYEQLMKSGADAWDSAKAGFGRAWDTMQSSIESARTKFN